MNPNSLDLRRRIAREAANLLYSGVEKEFKQAKQKAANTLGAHVLPANLEVALELDEIAEEREGAARQERLIQMRKEALNLMRILKSYNPLLIGSVWRGTIHHDSDMDVVVYHDAPEDVLATLKQNGVRIEQTEHVAVTKRGKRKSAFHIYAESPAKEKVEIKISNPEEATRKEKCGVYGDNIVGLNTQELGKLLKENPCRKFVPSLNR